MTSFALANLFAEVAFFLLPSVSSPRYTVVDKAGDVQHSYPSAFRESPKIPRASTRT